MTLVLHSPRLKSWIMGTVYKIISLIFKTLETMNKTSKKLTVTAINDAGNITAFFNELPGLVVQGNSMENVRNKLGALLKSFIKRLETVGDNFDIS